MSRENGGMAFPDSVAAGPAGDVITGAQFGWGPGLSKLEYFAAHAPANLMVFPDVKSAAEWMGEPEPTTSPELLAFGCRVSARISFMWAEAMLAEAAK